MYKSSPITPSGGSNTVLSNVATSMFVHYRAIGLGARCAAFAAEHRSLQGQFLRYSFVYSKGINAMQISPTFYNIKARIGFSRCTSFANRRTNFDRDRSSWPNLTLIYVWWER